MWGKSLPSQRLENFFRNFEDTTSMCTTYEYSQRLFYSTIILSATPFRATLFLRPEWEGRMRESSRRSKSTDHD